MNQHFLGMKHPATSLSDTTLKAGETKTLIDNFDHF